MPNFDTPVVQNITSIFTYANDVTSGWFGTSIVLLTFCIGLFAMIRWRIENAVVSSLFLTTVIAALLFAAGLVANFVVIWCVLGLVGVAVIKAISG